MCRRKRISPQLTLLGTETASEAVRKMNLSHSASGGNWKKSYSRNYKPCRHRNFPDSTWAPAPVVIEQFAQRRRLKKHWFTSAFLCSVWPKDHQPPNTLSGMNEEATAIWVEMLASLKGWEEARTYAQSFQANAIAGYMLPYLSVNALRSELGITKFGHRLEILAAIENDELTLIKPFVVTTQLDTFFMSNPEWVKKLENTNSHEREVEKWFSNSPRTNSISFKSRASGSIYSRSTSPEPDITCGPELHNTRFPEVTTSWKPKNGSWNDMISQSATNYFMKNKVKKRNYNSKNFSIPPIELPPAFVPEFDGEKYLDDMTMEFLRGGEERLSSIFSIVESETSGSFERMAQNNSCWGSLAVVVDSK